MSSAQVLRIPNNALEDALCSLLPTAEHGKLPWMVASVALKAAAPPAQACSAAVQTAGAASLTSTAAVAARIDILVVEPGDAGMFAAVNTTALAGFDPDSQWGTVPMDQVFALCETFMYGGNRSVAVTISSGNYSLVTGMTVQAAVGCEADDEDAPLQAW
ncbi:hypothetical protein N2152v2_006820 [Parachlorella kessleri]